MLTPTFSPELSHLFNVLPMDRQTCLFTATLTPSIENLIEIEPRPGKLKPFVHRMKEVCVNFINVFGCLVNSSCSIETVSTLKQRYILVPSHVRESYLYHLLCNPPESTVYLRRAPPETMDIKKRPKMKSKAKKSKDDDEDSPTIQPPPTIIFCSKPRTAAYLTLLLKSLLIRSTALHSRLTQRERLSSLSLFRASVVPVLISTDVGSRGLDIEEVAMVINWDLPNEPEEYVHRVGRTARAGRGGMAVSFVTERDEERILKIEERISEHSQPIGLFYTHLDFADTRLEEMEMPEDRVLEKLNTVSTAKRLANMVCNFCANKSTALMRTMSRNSVILILESGRRFTRLKRERQTLADHDRVFATGFFTIFHFEMSSCQLSQNRHTSYGRQRWTLFPTPCPPLIIAAALLAELYAIL